MWLILQVCLNCRGYIRVCQALHTDSTRDMSVESQIAHSLVSEILVCRVHWPGLSSGSPAGRQGRDAEDHRCTQHWHQAGSCRRDCQEPRQGWGHPCHHWVSASLDRIFQSRALRLVPLSGSGLNWDVNMLASRTVGLILAAAAEDMGSQIHSKITNSGGRAVEASWMITLPISNLRSKKHSTWTYTSS